MSDLALSGLVHAAQIGLYGLLGLIAFLIIMAIMAIIFGLRGPLIMIALMGAGLLIIYFGYSNLLADIGNGWTWWGAFFTIGFGFAVVLSAAFALVEMIRTGTWWDTETSSDPPASW